MIKLDKFKLFKEISKKNKGIFTIMYKWKKGNKININENVNRIKDEEIKRNIKSEQELKNILIAEIDLEQIGENQIRIILNNNII